MLARTLTSRQFSQLQGVGFRQGVFNSVRSKQGRGRREGRGGGMLKALCQPSRSTPRQATQRTSQRVRRTQRKSRQPPSQEKDRTRQSQHAIHATQRQRQRTRIQTISQPTTSVSKVRRRSRQRRQPRTPKRTSHQHNSSTLPPISQPYLTNKKTISRRHTRHPVQHRFP